MSYWDFKSEEEKVKIIADQKEKKPKTIHTVVSIIYIGVILLSSPLILWSLAYSYGLFIAVIWVIGSIIVSRILINRNNIPIAYLVLFSAPVIAWLFMIQ